LAAVKTPTSDPYFKRQAGIMILNQYFSTLPKWRNPTIFFLHPEAHPAYEKDHRLEKEIAEQLNDITRLLAVAGQYSHVTC
jgi:hypothetical protein